MSDYTTDFFDGKKSWSRIKDRILGSYMPAYSAKVSRLSQKIVFIDAFAGPGIFETDEIGSPLMICNAAEKYANGRYSALFINKDKTHHETLSEVLEKNGYSSTAKAILGDSNEVLKELSSLARQPASIFLYMDPYGLGITFETLLPFLNRSKSYSTEIMINLCAPVLHRLAGREATEIDEEVLSKRHQRLTDIFGGDYWRKSLLHPHLSAKDREEKLVRDYISKLSEGNSLDYAGFCPVQETRSSRAKYYMIFVATHKDAMILLNDEMLKSFESFMTESEGTLFSDLSWKDWRDLKVIREIAQFYIKQHQGKTRSEIWTLIVRDNFMRFSSSEYKQATKDLLAENLIFSPTSRRSLKLLNDDCQIFPVV